MPLIGGVIINKHLLIYLVFAAIFAVLIFSGCSSTHNYIHVQSYPPGADVDVNGRFAGKTPCTVSISRCQYMASKSYYGSDSTIKITASPTAQTKRYGGNYEKTRIVSFLEECPDKVLFDLTLKSQ